MKKSPFFMQNEKARKGIDHSFTDYEAINAMPWQERMLMLCVHHQRFLRAKYVILSLFQFLSLVLNLLKQQLADSKTYINMIKED